MLGLNIVLRVPLFDGLPDISLASDAFTLIWLARSAHDLATPRARPRWTGRSSRADRIGGTGGRNTA